MRRLLLWYLPLSAALAAAILFGSGFYSFLRGDTGDRVDVATGPRAASVAPRDTIAPLVIGDSLARGTGDETGLGIGGRLVEELKRRKVPVKNAVNVSVNGYRTRDVLQQLAGRNVQTILGEANVVIISAGGNDLWGDAARGGPMPNPQLVLNDVMSRVEEIVAGVRANSPKARIFVIGLYNPFIRTPFGATLTPLVTQWNSMLMQRFANDPNVVIVQTSDIFAYRERLSADQFHPGSEGYELIARRIADAI
jgi:lysophospholipase L1-like esterase